MFHKLLPTLTLSLVWTQAQAVVLPEGTKLADKQVVSYAIGSTPETLDPGINVDWNSQNVMKSLFDTLVRQDNTGAIVGSAAERWETSEDGKTWTFYLRPNATWSDGKPVLAADFVYAWQRVLDKKTGSLGAANMYALNLVNTKEVNEGSKPPQALGAVAKSDFVLELHLTRPTPWLLQALTFVNTAPVRADKIAEFGNSWTRHDRIVSNGPYKLSDYRFNEKLSFAKRADYWDAKNIYISDIVYNVLPRGESSYLRYLKGEFYTVRVPAQYADVINQERPEEVVKEAYPTNAVILLNNEGKFADQRVRQALSLLLDRQYLTKHIFKAFFPSSTFVPALDSVSDAQGITEVKHLVDSKFAQANRQQAISLLKQAGYSVEKPLEFTWSYEKRKDSDRDNIALQGMLQQFSGGLVKVKLQAKDRTSYYSDIAAKKYEAAYYFMNADFYHAASYFNYFLPTHQNNFTGYNSPTFAELYERALDELDAQKRQQLYGAMNTLLQQDMPAIPVILTERYILRSPALGGFNGKLPFTYMRDYYIIADKQIAPTK